MSAIIVHEDVVRPEWVDYNDHLNDACYAIVFSAAVDALFATFGLDAQRRASTGSTVYTLSMLNRFLREARLGTRLVIDARVLARDARRVHLWLNMRSADGVVLATSEQVLVSVRQGDAGAATCEWPASIGAAVDALMQQQAGEPWPRRAGQGLSLTPAPA